jgi:RimJ/RimL family protein N-acetyltransferase
MPMNIPYTFSGPVRTERLLIRAEREDDVDDIHAYRGREDVCLYLPFTPRTRDEVAEKVAIWSQQLTIADETSFWQLAVERLEEPGRVIGDVFFSLRSIENETAEIGWITNPDYARRGYATEAVSALLRIAFEEIQVHRVFAQLDPRNVASIALCKRLGLREEACFVEDVWFKGEWADTGVYGMLAREWPG